ncbi:uncharacterized protein MELLADRAFT_63283 [Melampsora larici-populina 98AG31]|uniref:Uncharacterized protein n=1 Tax=Melampsora larici-populina (strain 98AG31 / pathotype 3-4-7) TaxID=747676 RepID=F4RM35_MELLP|nr:uncharacterized protein MELLADRAFT_63283 [Melampsora larici-populina 98AG31]EGG06657.1 hypothetical protein MELLADRAFT_63283 [Melampsora larici-populina 98AG31]
MTYLRVGLAGKTLQTEQDNRHEKGEYSDDLPIPSDSPFDLNNPDQEAPSNGQSLDRTSYHRAAKSQTSAVPSHGLTPSSAASQTSNQTLQPHSSEPSLTPHELQMVHRSISTTKVPSWLTRVPNQIGTTRSGTPKAAEWLTLYTIYMVVSLIPYLHNSEPNSTSFNIHKALTLATGIINIAVSRTMTNQDINDIVGQTMIKQHTLKTIFTNLCENTPPIYAALIGAQTLMKTGRTHWKPFTVSPEISETLKPVLIQMGFIDIPKLESVSIWKHAGKSYSTFTKHVGNSRIEFKFQGKSSFGEIQHILRIASHSTPIFVINPFSALTPVDNLKSPFQSLPYLHASVLYQQYQPSVAIPMNCLFGHIALVENPPGTLDISLLTLYVVSLRSLTDKDKATQGIMDMTSTHTDMPSA